METLNSLENFNILEKKIALLIDSLKAEKSLNARLLEEKNSLAARLESLENSLMQESKSIEELTQERALTKMMVDELIQNIDRLVDGMPSAPGV